MKCGQSPKNAYNIMDVPVIAMPQQYSCYMCDITNIHGLLDWKRSEEHLQSSNESIKQNQKQRSMFQRDNPLLKPTGIHIATKFLLGPNTREHREPIRVKTMCLDTNYRVYYLGCCQYFQILQGGLPDVLHIYQKP